MILPLVLILCRGKESFRDEAALGAVPLAALLALDIFPVRLADHSRSHAYAEGLCQLVGRIDAVLLGRGWQRQAGGLAAVRCAVTLGKPVLSDLEQLRAWALRHAEEQHLAAVRQMSAGAGDTLAPCSPVAPGHDLWTVPS